MEVRIYQNFQRDQTNIIILEKETHSVFNLYSGEAKTIKTGEEIPDDFVMRIPSHIVNDLFKALADALDQQGIKTEMDAKIEGKFEATKYHLEDLRKLLKLKS